MGPVADDQRPTSVRFLPYGKQEISDADVDAVVAALRGDLITQGPLIDEFERAFAEAHGAPHAVAFSNGTAALHGAAAAAGLGPGDEVVTSPVTFVASANCALFVGATPRFSDIDPQTWNLDTRALAASELGERAAAVVAVSLTGRPVDLESLQQLRERGTVVIEDAAHAAGARRASEPVGAGGLADMTCFSFHPVKSMTTAEGGIVTTADDELAARLRAFRTHGISRPEPDSSDPLLGPWHYSVDTLGFNYRITDLQCALGLSQLGRLGGWIARRNEIAARYDELLRGAGGLTIAPPLPPGEVHGRHLYVVRFDDGPERRRAAAERLREAGIGTQLHYIPIPIHPLYRERGYKIDGLPEAIAYYEQALSLPMFPGLTPDEVEYVAAKVREVAR